MRHIAAKLAVDVARNPDDSAESEVEPAVGVEPRHRRQVGSDRFEANRPAVEAVELDAAWAARSAPGGPARRESPLRRPSHGHRSTVTDPLTLRVPSGPSSALPSPAPAENQLIEIEPASTSSSTGVAGFPSVPTSPAVHKRHGAPRSWAKAGAARPMAPVSATAAERAMQAAHDMTRRYGPRIETRLTAASSFISDRSVIAPSTGACRTDP